MELAQLKRAIAESNKLSSRGANKQALEVLDQAITEAKRESCGSCEHTLLRHASVIAEACGKLQLAKKYRRRCVALDPNSPQALFDLAAILNRLGELRAARRYASRAYNISKDRNDEVAQSIIESLLLIWPDIT